VVTGHIDLTDSADKFLNRSGGKFRAMDTSSFGGGSDLFYNGDGGVLRVESQGANAEQTKFVGLEKFENKGLITMVDGQNNDEFTISNTPGGKDLNFVGSGNSQLAVDAFLGGPGSRADHFIVEGNTSGRTALAVNNTNASSARYDPVGIPVVFVKGKVDKSNFYLPKPDHAGFFDYDLFFKPTGSGFSI
jgi:autotransporter family porin